MIKEKILICFIVNQLVWHLKCSSFVVLTQSKNNNNLNPCTENRVTVASFFKTKTLFHFLPFLENSQVIRDTEGRKALRTDRLSRRRCCPLRNSHEEDRKWAPLAAAGQHHAAAHDSSDPPGHLITAWLLLLSVAPRFPCWFQLCPPPHSP